MSHAIWAVVYWRSRFRRISRVLWTNAECALETAYDAPNRAAYNSTNWSGCIVSNVCAVRDAVRNPLRKNSHGPLEAWFNKTWRPGEIEQQG